jgi:hypothetical protein
LRGEVGGFPFEPLPMLVLGESASAISGLLPLSVGLRGEVRGFPFEALLMLVVGFAVRTEAAFAISGLPLRLAFNVAVDRRFDFVLLAFLAMGSPVEGCVVKSCPLRKKGAMRGRTAVP